MDIPVPNYGARSKCLVVLSGGQDSSTCAFWARHYFNEVHCVTFDYNQRHRREIESASKIAKIIGAASHSIIELGPILHGRSPLTNPDEKLESYENYEQMDAMIGDRVELTFVPMRNALFLTIAANRASCLGVEALVTGVCQADNANYPDCRETFIRMQELAINAALGHDIHDPTMCGHVSIHTPLMNMTKAQSIALARSLDDAFPALAFTHTAYDGQYPPVGNDHATILRAHGFEEAGLPDPLVLRAWNDGDMDLPRTANYESMEVNAFEVSRIEALGAKL